MPSKSKGHVPPENLSLYRYYRDRSREAETLAGVLSGLGHFDLANAMYQAEAVLKDRANELRVDLAQ